MATARIFQSKVQVKLSLYLTKYRAMKTCLEVEGTGQLHAPATLHPEKNNLRYPLDRRLGGPQSRSGSGAEEKKIPAPPGNQTPVVQPVV
jgi:hypothetical protein